MKTILISFLSLLFAFTLHDKGISIHGEVKVASAEKRKQLWDASILIMKDSNVIASTEVDSSSHFNVNIDKLDAKGSTVRADLYFVSLGKIVYIKPVTLIPNSTVYCDVELPNQYNKNVLGDVICPRCGKTEMVVSNEGKGAHPTLTDAYPIMIPDKTGNYPEEVLAQWYCKKCRIKF